MKKLAFLLIVGAFVTSGIFTVSSKKTPVRLSHHEVPERPSQRGPASTLENSYSQVAALSVRPSADATAGLTITETQIRLMEENLSGLQRDISLFKDTEGWVVRFHHSSNLMTSLGVKDGDLISFKQLQKMKTEPALNSLARRLEGVFTQLQK